MTWAKVDDGFPEHPKVEPLTDRAFRLHVTALCYCNRNLTDGVLTSKAVRAMCAATKARKKHVDELVFQSLWGALDDGFNIHDYLEWNPSSMEVKNRRAEARERMAAIRERERTSERALERSDEHAVERSQNVPEWRGVTNKKSIASLRFFEQAKAVWKTGGEPETRVYLAGFTDDEDVIAAHITALEAVAQ
jgi:hypothetical protein